MSRSLRRAFFGPAVLLVACSVLAACGSSSSSSTSSSSGSSGSAGAGGLKKGLKVFVIPKNLGNPYFTTADSVNSGGALAALGTLGETGSETSGTAATPASQIPAIQSAITKGANILIVSATDPSALCPTLNSAMAKGITVVMYDSDAPSCRDLFVNQASTAQIGTSEVDLLAKEIGSSGDIGIVSAAASAPNQNAWIGYMKQQLKKYPKMHLVSIVYGNDDPTTATQVTQGLLQQHPNLKGIISPPTRRSTSPPRRSPAPPGSPSPPASSASTPWARTAPSCSARRSCSPRPTSTTSTSDLPNGWPPGPWSRRQPGSGSRAPAGSFGRRRPPRSRPHSRCQGGADAAGLLPRPGPAGPAGGVPGRPPGGLARDARRAARGGLGQLQPLPGRRRAADRLSGNRRLRRGTAADGAGWRERALAGRDGAVLRWHRRPAPRRGVSSDHRDIPPGLSRPARDRADPRALPGDDVRCLI